ncbi:XRE family transcriptional regulator [Secundilactobacillus oryzae]|nr:XRE family transcriptional regulator [Secundilactobacillus oryzae]
MDNSNAEFGSKLKELRNKKGFTVRQLALQAGISNSYLSQVENGKRSIPKPATLEKIAKGMHVPKEDIFLMAGISNGNDAPEWATEKDFADLEKYLNDNTKKNFEGAVLDDEAIQATLGFLRGYFWQRVIQNDKASEMTQMNDKIKNDINTIINRYHTADPFAIADKLNIDVVYAPFKQEPKGMTFNYGDQPVIALSNEIKESNQRYFVVAHELGHAVEQADLSAYYTARDHWKRELEVEADKFAVALLSELYVEQHDEMPRNWFDLVHEYGFPIIGE